jgi:predicted dehydrogenase
MKTAGLGALGMVLSAGQGIGAETTDAPKIRWGLVGTGKRCWQHIKVLQRFGEYRIVALCDIQKDRLDHAMEMCKADPPVPYDAYHDLLKRDDLDVILVATPNYVHREVVVAALKSGRHVLTEKPMGITVEECNDMIGTAKGSGKILQVGLQLRYAPFYQKVHSLLREGIIGKPKFVWFNEFRGDWAKQSADPKIDNKINWRFYQKLSGGTLLEKSCHYFDLFRWMIGTEPVRVCGMGGVNFYTNGRETLDHASVVVEFEGDCKATHGLSMYSPHGQGFFIIGEKGALDLNWETGDIVVKRQGKKDEILRADVSNQDTGGHIGTGEMHASFLDCIRTGKPPLTDPVAGKQSIRLGLAAEKSIREKRWVEMSEIGA